MSLIIEIKTIPQEQHRYETIGDYVGHERLRFIQISDMGNAKYEFLIALHEMIEQALCLERGIAEESITKFDKEFKGEGEPGDDPSAPYYNEHQFATKVEEMVCKEIGLDWNAYGRYLNEFMALRGLND
jgi:hypothetical protein